MGVRRDYDGWSESDELDREAAALLAYLDCLADVSAGLPSELAAQFDVYGVVTSTIALDGGAEVYLQAGDGCDRVLWTYPSGRTYEWTWRAQETPRDLDALFAGRHRARDAVPTTPSRRPADRALAVADGRLRLAVIQRLGLRPGVQERPAG